MPSFAAPILLMLTVDTSASYDPSPRVAEQDISYTQTATVTASCNGVRREVFVVAQSMGSEDEIIALALEGLAARLHR